jgi:hypothetical protein
VDAVTSVIETVHQHAQIWACMQKTTTIVTALNTAHRFWSNQHVHCRALLDVLMEMDNGNHLDGPSRERIESDITTFTHVNIDFKVAMRYLLTRIEPVAATSIR